MRRSFADLLVDPTTKTPLELEIEIESETDGDIMRGSLRGPDGRVFPVRDGIPRLVVEEDESQHQTSESFGYKWRRRSSFDSDAMQDVIRRRVVQNYGFGSVEAMRAFFSSRRRILDAGCGAGLPTSAWMEPGWSGGRSEWVGLDISGAIDVAYARLGHVDGTHFVQGDVLNLPFPRETFDAIFSEGVLHHTPSTERGVQSLVDVLSPGGELLFYVYRRKAPIREFTDDFVRERIAGLPPEEAWDSLRSLTLLGQALSELEVEVDVPEDVPLLGIAAGRYDVQRLLYWHVAKLYWNHRLSFEENQHVNFDWYHPRYAHRQTAGEVRSWCQEAGLEIVHFHESDAGFTVRAIRRAQPGRARA